MNLHETKPYTLACTIKDGVNSFVLKSIFSQVSVFVNKLQSDEKIMQSVTFDDEVLSMAVFEDIEECAKNPSKNVQSYILMFWDDIITDWV